MDQDHLLHNVRLIKDNPLISSMAKEEVEKMVRFLLEVAKTNSEIKYVLYRLEQAKNQDEQLDHSAAFDEIFNHVKKVVQ